MAALAALITNKAVCITLEVAVEAAKFSVKQVYGSIVALRLNEKLQDELCRKVKQLESILKTVETTAHDTNDKPILQAIEEVDQDLKKCLTVCDRIEKKKIFSKFWSAIKDSKELQELDSLLIHSLQVLNTRLTASSYNTNTDRQRDLRRLETVIRNPQTGIYRLDREDLSVPEKVEKPCVKEVSPGQLEVCWIGVASASQCMRYELEYDQRNENYEKVEQNHTNYYKYLLDSTKISFPNKFSYSIRIRGINGKGIGEWSECAVGKFTILPSPPRKPLAIHVNSSTSVTLVMEKPPEEDRVKPATHYVVEYHETEHHDDGAQEFVIEDLDTLTFQGKNAYEINMKWNIDTTPMPMYHVKISLRNPDGVSKVYQDEIITGNIRPGKPVKPDDSDLVVYTNTRTIIIEWNEPETNAYVVDHYEVLWGRDRKIAKIRKTKNCYAVFRSGLESWKKYLFKVRAVSRTGIKSDFLEISAETDSKAGKVAKALGAGAAGAAGTIILSPFVGVLTGIGAGAAAGAAAADSVEEKGKGKAAEVAASTAAGVGAGAAGLAVGVIVTPVAIAASPFVGIATGIAAPFKVRSLQKEELDRFLKKYPDDSKDEDLKTDE